MVRPSASCVFGVVALIVVGAAEPASAQPLDQSLVLDVTATGPGPDALAAHAPAAQRPQVTRMLEQVLATYHQLEQKLGLRTNEPGGAIAAFVTGNLAAAQRVEIADAAFAAFVAQMRTGLAAHPDVASRLHLDRPAVVEQIEIIGLMMMLSQRTKSDAATLASMSAGARSYVRQYLGFDIADVELTGAGLHWKRGAPTGPLAVLFASGAAEPRAGVPEAPPAPATSDRAPPSASGDIETVGFDTKVSVGAGGSFTYIPAPVVLFKSGEALLDITGLGDPDGLAHHKQTHPSYWTTWRRAGGAIERQKDGKWTKLSYAKVMGPLPARFTLDGSYSTIGGGGNLAYGGHTTITSWNNLRFDRSGRFSTDGGGSLSSPSVVASGERAATGGSYDIAGYLLKLRFGDGHTETRTIVTEASDPSVIWVNGISFTRK